MPYSVPGLQGTAGGNINPSRIVKFSTVADNTFLQSTANTDKNIGISQIGTRRPPGTADDDGTAAHAGENIQVFGQGSIAILQVGTVAVTRGDQLTSDTNGCGLTTTTTGDFVVGYAMQSGNPGDLIEVDVQPYVL
jgi:hypothetical protein